MGEGPIAHPHQPPDSGAQGPGARPKALACRHPDLGWFSVGVRRLEEAGATGLACRDAHSRLLTRSSLRSPGGPGVQSSSLQLYNGRVAVFCRVRGYGRRRAWHTMVSPTRGTPFPFRPLYAWRVRCWSACVLSVYRVASLLLQRFGWCFVVLAASWSACSSLGLFCCCQRCRVLGSAWSFVQRPAQPV